MSLSVLFLEVLSAQARFPIKPQSNSTDTELHFLQVKYWKLELPALGEHLFTLFDSKFRT